MSEMIDDTVLSREPRLYKRVVSVGNALARRAYELVSTKKRRKISGYERLK